MQEGWKCPQCGQVNAPWMSYCQGCAPQKDCIGKDEPTKEFEYGKYMPFEFDFKPFVVTGPWDDYFNGRKET